MLRLFIDEIIDDNNLLYLSPFDVNKDQSLSSLFSRFSNIKGILWSPFLSFKRNNRPFVFLALISVRIYLHHLLSFVCISFTHGVGSTDISVLTSHARSFVSLSCMLFLSIFFSKFSDSDLF